MAQLNLGLITNCQGGPLVKKSLVRNSDFRKEYTFIPFEKVQNLKPEHEKVVKKYIKKCDLILLQPIFNHEIECIKTNQIRELCAETNTKTIMFPSLYFDAYFPWIGKRLTIRGKKSIFNNTEDYLLTAIYLLGMDEKQARRFILDYQLPETVMSNRVQNSLASLKQRENDGKVDVTVSDIYEKLIKNYELHNSHNHPRLIILDEVAKKILTFLGFSDKLENNIISEQHQFGMGKIKHPIKPSVYKSFGLKFDYEPEIYSTSRGSMNLEKVISNMWSYYSSINKDKLKLTLSQECPSVIQELGI